MKLKRTSSACLLTVSSCFPSISVSTARRAGPPKIPTPQQLNKTIIRPRARNDAAAANRAMEMRCFFSLSFVHLTLMTPPKFTLCKAIMQMQKSPGVLYQFQAATGRRRIASPVGRCEWSSRKSADTSSAVGLSRLPNKPTQARMTY